MGVMIQAGVLAFVGASLAREIKIQRLITHKQKTEKLE
jgi:hypothetical protein